MTLEEILWALTNCDVATRQVKVSYEAAEVITAKLRRLERLERAGQEMRTPLTGVEILLRGKYPATARKLEEVMKAWDAAVRSGE